MLGPQTHVVFFFLTVYTVFHHMEASTFPHIIVLYRCSCPCRGILLYIILVYILYHNRHSVLSMTLNCSKGKEVQVLMRENRYVAHPGLGGRIE